MAGPAFKQLLLPLLPAAALWLPRPVQPQQFLPMYLGRTVTLGHLSPAMVLQAEEVHMLVVTPKRAKPD